ncbi:fumarylacetoacetate hydrolase family protein [Cytobacillus gottheilii]|uniref:fumarylacetoacetate hydrolase family protein n=1 Tax=Cytobacillus gottheilii TaxID=859144 RepID=UPI0009BB4494|nr:fumarylacetoacetate hydrolase family protein [Cytobacillus gottheilii]
MKLLTFKKEERISAGVLMEDEHLVLDLSKAASLSGQDHFPGTLLECIQGGNPIIDEITKIKEWAINNPENAKETIYKVDEIELLAPIPRPLKNVFCIGKNYAEHAIEMGSKDDIPEHIMVFTKAPTTVIGHEQVIEAHESVTAELDYEGELAIIIGKTGRAISREDAMDYVFGYTIVNDVTARDLQKQHKQFFLGKSLDSTCPMGPWIVPAAFVENPSKLSIQTRVNGEVRQNSATDQLIFPLDEIISVLSSGMTLEPGDVIATGTPAGVGKGFKPPRYLKKGDTIEIEIEGIGTLKNTVGSTKPSN